MENEFKLIISKSSDKVREIATSARNLMLKVAPDSHEVIWGNAREAGYGFGPKKLTEHYTRILLNKDYVTFMFEHGVRLLQKDKRGLLEGSGSKCRHVKIRNVSDVENEDLIELIKIAIAERKEALGIK